MTTNIDVFIRCFPSVNCPKRCDYRNEVLKDIERHLLQLNKWQELDHVDHQQINIYINALTQAREQLQKPERFGSQLNKINLFPRYDNASACQVLAVTSTYRNCIIGYLNLGEEKTARLSLLDSAFRTFAHPSHYYSNSPAVQPITTMPLPTLAFIKATVPKHLLW